jgi:hypothetical protein
MGAWRACEHACAEYRGGATIRGMPLDPGKGVTRVSLLRWLRRQLRQAEPLRERLEAAIAVNDVGEARRIVARFEFSPAQQRHVGRLLDEWEHDLLAPVHDLDAPGAP